MNIIFFVSTRRIAICRSTWNYDIRSLLFNSLKSVLVELGDPLCPGYDEFSTSEEYGHHSLMLWMDTCPPGAWTGAE